MNFTIREARGTDAESITRVLNPIIETRTNSVYTEAFSVDAEQEFIVKFPKRGVFHVAESDGIVKGFQTIESFATYTTALDHVGIIGTFVGFLYQKQGIGKALFQASFVAARAKGYEKLFAFVRADNTAGLAAYLEQGFTQVGIAKNHAKIDGKYVDEIIIERFLPGLHT
jgi:L-amino acid N-acyltransferase YncA